MNNNSLFIDDSVSKKLEIPFILTSEMFWNNLKNEKKN